MSIQIVVFLALFFLRLAISLTAKGALPQIATIHGHTGEVDPGSWTENWAVKKRVGEVNAVV
jgi:hypothetical protein